MSIGTRDNMIVRPDFFEEGMIETINQNVNVFNAAVNNTLALVSLEQAGDFAKTRFIQRLTNVIQSRDDTSNDGVNDTPLEQEEDVSVKVKRRIGPFANTLDSFRSVGMGGEELSFWLGQQTGEEAAKDYFDNLVFSLVGALANDSSDLIHDTEGETLDHSAILKGMAKFGDASQRLRAIVMHSKPFFDLMENQLDNQDVGGEVVFATIYNANVGSFTRPIVVTDSAALKFEEEVEPSEFEDRYRTLLLTEGAGAVTESHAPVIWDDRITGQENLAIRIQGEHAFNLEVKGYAWNQGEGGRNPDTSALSSAASWDSILGNIKDKAGVIVETA